ncbi:phospholipid/cholesterol/gamma-HCH transport system substrate-binding protein [Micromonospora pallida]|uniref:Phospholipid/cholesterol/gamma-HCH transport system substrate-binding protein n=1 Tax=Micromonospora pallida TaxID=145854 RepID=A0A1C6SDV8_9ACTN|nr:MCE family protein [Micromonospora pallida]SCL27645.1 phospholipid/cholesterol/gamma-HCH transport system substrate-binding protein [Micromonospora pallida]
MSLSLRRWRPVAAATVLLVGVAAGFVALSDDTPPKRVVAHFTRAVGVYPGSDVRVLGVRVGEVVAVTPRGRTVEVTMRYDPELDVPADAQAIIVPPSVVSDRYVQLTPAYAGGAVLPDGAEIALHRTVAPMEIDDIYQALDEFNRALGPAGANRDGALSDLVTTGRENLDGNGQNLHDTLDGLSRALTTLSDGRQDLFGSVANLQRFTTALARSDQQVRAFNQQLADVAEQLAGEREELAAALRNLATALADVTTFVRQNRTLLTSNVAALTNITSVLVRQQRAVIEILDVTPLALSNLNLAYNARSGTLDTRDNVTGPYGAVGFVCSLLADALPAAEVPKKCLSLAQTLHAQGVPLTDKLRKLAKLPARPAGPTTPKPDDPPPAAPTTPSPDLGDVTSGGDRTLGGILRGAS